MPKLVYKDPNIKVFQWHERIPELVEPYTYKKAKPALRPEPNTIKADGKPEEFLTGWVHGNRASALEERFAKALDFFGLTYSFEYVVPVAHGLPHEGKNIDFIVFDGGLAMPIEVGATFTHGRPSQEEAEGQRMAIINEVLPMLGIQYLTDESYLPLDRPTDIEDAKDLVAQLFFSV